MDGTLIGHSGYYSTQMILLFRRYRFLTFLIALVQLALPGALGVIDAMSAWNGRGTVAHIEETTGQQCRTPHSDECIICQHLSTGVTKSNPASVVLPQKARMQPAASAEVHPRSVLHRGFRSRAPPETVI